VRSASGGRGESDCGRGHRRAPRVETGARFSPP
jgi:hypothetical protein